MVRMRRIQIVMTPELDDWLAREARARGLSKSALVRECVRRESRPLPPPGEDAIWELVGIGEGQPDDSLSVNAVVYGARDE
jgi:hypothetical protein